ncbi:unnamed protein product [Urochloa decumbens]|uniref:Thioredoxin-like protein n=1 Tax=Urochloa decumbens TaxID=240449 RepID=A0ABC8ZXY4_9POAL
MAYQVEHLHSVQAVDDAINREGDSGSGRLVVVRFGRGGHPDCARLDAALAAAGEQVADVAALYAVDTGEVTGYNDMYELHGLPCTVMFFHGYRHVDVRGERGRDAVDWAAYTGHGLAALFRAVHRKANKAGRWRTLFIVD